MFWFSIIPPALCVVIGLVAVVVGRRNGKAWAFFALMLCLSQIHIVPGGFGDWSQAADPMEWRDWFRIPAVGYQSFFSLSWPAWLLLFVSYSFQPLANRLTRWAVAAIVSVTALEAVLVLGWSESFRTVAGIYSAAGFLRPELAAAAFVLTAVVTSRFQRIWAAASAIIAVLAVMTLYWLGSPYALMRYPNTVVSGFELAHPLYSFRTPEVIGATFAVIMFILAVAACWHWSKVIEYVGVFLLIIPFLYDAASAIWGV